MKQMLSRIPVPCPLQPLWADSQTPKVKNGRPAPRSAGCTRPQLLSRGTAVDRINDASENAPPCASQRQLPQPQLLSFRTPSEFVNLSRSWRKFVPFCRVLTRHNGIRANKFTSSQAV